MTPLRIASGAKVALLAVSLPFAVFGQDAAPASPPVEVQPGSASAEAATADAAPAEAAPAKEASASPASGSGSEAGTLADGEKIELLDYPDTEIATIVREVAELYGLNVIVPDTLVGNTSLRLRNVTWRQVFEIILGQVDFTFIEADGIIRIVSRSSLGSEPVRTEVLNLQFAKASEIQAIIVPMLKEPERIQVDGRTNSLILTVGLTKGKEIREIINRLDGEPGDAKQVLIDTKFIEANLSDVKNIGVNWASLESYALKAGPITRNYDRTFTQDKEFGSNATSTSSNTLGNNSSANVSGSSAGNASPSGFTQGTTSASQIGSVADRLANVTGATTAERATTAVFNAAEFNLILSALKSASNVKLMSNPTVVSLTNEEAKINVTTKFPIILTTSTPGASGASITETKQDEEYGISLKVTPQIRPQGLISLNITPEVSNLDGFNTGSSGNRYPIISRRSVNNRVNLRDGYTIALGGLVQTQNTDASTRVPVLGDLPGLGRLFRSKSEKMESRNLIVFITARVIDPAGNVRDPATQANFDTMLKDTVDPRMIRKMGVERFDLPGFRPEMSTFPTEEEVKALEEARKEQEEGKSKSKDEAPAPAEPENRATTARPFIK